MLAYTSFKLRNERSYLGIMWYLLNPILLFGILLLIFSSQFGTIIEQYELYVFTGIIIFNFFRSATIESVHILYEYRHLIKSIPLPFESLLFSTTLKTLYGHLFEIIFFVMLLVYFNVPVIGIMWYLPLLFMLMLFTYGVSLILASIVAFFADIENIWIFFSQLLWFATPIFYTLSEGGLLTFFNTLNPLYYFIIITRDIVVYERLPEVSKIFFVLVCTFCALAIGLFIFRSVRYKFVEVL